MKYKILISALVAAIFGIGGLSQPTFAADEIQPRSLENQPVTTSDDNKEIRPTFIEENPTEDLESLRFGHNLLLAGNVYDSNASAQGLLFSAGNVMNLKADSEYGFYAGNSVTISSKIEKDLFVAGNTITIANDAKIGRDVFAAGNVITLNSNIPGDVSIGASKVIIKGIDIGGNLNIDAETVVIEGESSVAGRFIVNADAEISGIDRISYAELEKYENLDIEVTAADIMVGVILGIICLFVTFVVVLAMFPGINKKVEKELTSIQFGKDLVVGICTLIFIPFICIFLLISIIGSLAGVVLMLAYVLMLILSLAFTGFWLGKLIMEKAFQSQMNPFLEALIGIILVKVLGMVPVFGGYVTLIAVVLGLGLIMQCLRTRVKKSSGNKTIEEAEVIEETAVEAKPKAKKSTNTTTAKSDKTEE